MVLVLVGVVIVRVPFVVLLVVVDCVIRDIVFSDGETFFLVFVLFLLSVGLPASFVLICCFLLIVLAVPIPILNVICFACALFFSRTFNHRARLTEKHTIYSRHCRREKCAISGTLLMPRQTAFAG